MLNLCRERLRTRRRLAAHAKRAGLDTDRELPVADIPDDTVPDAWRTIEADEQRCNLERALEALPDIYRQVIVLRCYEGLSYTEIAQVMQCRKRTVRWRLYRARQILRGCLKECGLTGGNGCHPLTTVRGCQVHRTRPDHGRGVAPTEECSMHCGSARRQLSVYSDGALALCEM